MNKVTRVVSISTLALAALASGAAHADPGKTREQVQAELVAAQKAGDVPVGEDGLTPRERFPWLYPAVGTAEPGKTREQVKAELAAAQQNGDIVMSFAGKTDPRAGKGRTRCGPAKRRHRNELCRQDGARIVPGAVPSLRIGAKYRALRYRA